MVVDRGDLMLLHEGDKRVEEVPKHTLRRPQRRAIGGQAVNHHAFGLEVLHETLDLREVTIDLDLLRRIVLHLHQAAGDGPVEIDADGAGIARDLRRRLVETEDDTALAAPSAFRNVLETHDALADPGDADDQRRAPEEVATIHEVVQAWHTGWHTRRGIVGGG